VETEYDCAKLACIEAGDLPVPLVAVVDCCRELLTITFERLHPWNE
jgi:hypothetical protein